MADKAYIVANKEQELDVLKKFEEKDLFLISGAMPTDWLPSRHSNSMLFEKFPYILCEGDEISWITMGQLSDEEIVYDGRKEDKMTKKYRVTKKFMDELNEWKRANFNDDFMVVDENSIVDFPAVIDNWWYSAFNGRERNERLIAIIQWLNGEDVF
jgi:hypothetical protein